MLDLLGLRVRLLLALLGTAQQLERQEERRLVLQPACRQLLRTLEGPAAKDQPLLPGIYALCLLNLVLQARNVCCGICGDGQRLPSEVADEELHRRRGHAHASAPEPP